jgi:dienelactone hydrolase
MLAALAVVAGALASPVAAGGAVPATLHDPANCAELEPAPGLSAFRCDDGVPAIGGGLIANPTGASAITVPAKYGGDGYTGLPAKAADAEEMPGADGDGMIAVDANVTLPGAPPPADGYPLLVLMHGCCGGSKASHEQETVDADGEAWHYSDAWFASRGYAVLTYTARGFVNRENRGSSGQSQLQSRSFEINDFQHLACQLVASAPQFGGATGQAVAIDPRRVVVTGGSYGGGFSWLALTDPRWTCTPDTGTGGTEMRLAAAAPKYGWTDLAYTLVPNGLHARASGALPATDGCDTGPRTLDGDPCGAGASPVGVPKTSIIAGLFVTGVAPAVDHTTFTPAIAEGFACLTATYPLETSPLCANVLESTLPAFLRERSAYYQNRFFERIASDPGHRVPVFNAAAFTDPLFPSQEHRRMVDRLLEVVPGYPVRTSFGDYQHFTQNKAKEWGDICDTGDGRGRRVCEFGDYPGGDLDAEPDGLVRTGLTTELNRFLDHYARPVANPEEPEPDFEVSATLQVCPDSAGPGQPADEPGPTFAAPTLAEIAPHALRIDIGGDRTTTSAAVPNPHAASSDPVVNEQLNGGACPVEDSPAGPGVATYDSDPLPSTATMVGSTQATVDFEVRGPIEGLQLNARLYDVLPDGRALMVDRGTGRITPAEAEEGTVTLGLHGNGWRFPAGHRVRIELAQDDSPFVRHTDVPSSLSLSGVLLRIPVREAGVAEDGGDDEEPGTGAGPPRGDGEPGEDDRDRGADREAGPADDRSGGTGSPGAAAATDASGGGLPLTGLSVAVLVAIALALLAAGRLGRRAARRYS